MIYILIFFSSTFFAFCAQGINTKGIKIVVNNEKKYSIAHLYILLCALGPILLGTFRSIQVGTDNRVYQIRFESISSIDRIKEALQYANLDVGYNFLMYLTSRVSESYNAFCFLTSLITFTCVLFAFWKLRRYLSLPMAVLTYLFIYYCNMYNLVRQGVALAICFLAFTYLLERRIKAFLILVIIGCFIHSTSFVMLTAWPLYRYLNAGQYFIKSNNRKFLLRSSLIIVLAVIVTLLWRQILNVFVSIGILGSKYIEYSSYGGYVNVPYRQIILFAVLLLIIIIFRPYMANKYKDYNLICIMSMIGFTFTLLSIYFSAMGRIGLYFFYPAMININTISVTLDKKSRLIFNIFLLLYLMVFWYMLTVLNGYGYAVPVYPYVSIFD